MLLNVIKTERNHLFSEVRSRERQRKQHMTMNEMQDNKIKE